jgi:hypothetical protein
VWSLKNSEFYIVFILNDGTIHQYEHLVRKWLILFV